MNKERLAKTTYNPCDECNYAFHKHNQESGMCKLCEFKSYRDLEEQNLLLRLPCKVGDTLYQPKWGHILAYKVSGVSFNVSKFKLFQNGVLEKVYPDYSNKPFFKCLDEQCDFDDIGKNIFLTQSEAEERLRELEGK